MDHNDEYILCNLFENYIESLLFFKFLCQTMNFVKIKSITYSFPFNKLLIKKIVQILYDSKFNDLLIIHCITYL